MLQRTDRVVIAVGDLEKAKKEMVAVLGRTPAWVGGYPADQTECVLFHLDNLNVELLSPAPGGDTPVCKALQAQLDEHGGGLFALHLETEDIANCLEGIRSQGLEPCDPYEGLTKDEPSGAFRRFVQSDLPEDQTAGVRLRIVEWQSNPEELPPSLPLAGEASAVTGGDHVVIFTAAPERVIDLFGTKLGVRLALDKTFEKRKTRLIFFRLGGYTIEIGAPFRDPTDEPVPDDRLWGLAFRVGDIDAVSERIKNAGLEVTGIRDGNKPGTRVFTVRNEPAGVATLIIQHD